MKRPRSDAVHQDAPDIPNPVSLPIFNIIATVFCSNVDDRVHLRTIFFDVSRLYPVQTAVGEETPDCWTNHAEYFHML